MVMIDLHKLLHWCQGHREGLVLAWYLLCFFFAYRNARKYQLNRVIDYGWEEIFGNVCAGVMGPFYLIVVLFIRLNKWWTKKDFHIKAPRWL